MLETTLRAAALAGLLAVSGCGDDGEYISFRDAAPDAMVPVDSGTNDAPDRPPDAGAIDAGLWDAEASWDAEVTDAPVVDAGSIDAGPPDAMPAPDAMPLSVLAIASGGRHTCALVSGGAVRCWGYNVSGQLGLAHTNNIGDNEPAGAGGDVLVGGAVDELAVGSSHTCARIGGAVRCWGAAGDGQLGYANTVPIGDDEEPSLAGDVTLGGAASAVVSGGGHHTCALVGGAVRCWGRNDYGQLGYGDTLNVGDNETPASAGDVSVGGTVTQIALGFEHTCALISGGTVRCWGRNQHGQLGYGNTAPVGDDELPSSMGTVNVGGTVVELAAGRYHTCARLDTGAVRCWGRGAGGALGFGNTDDIGDNEAPSSAGDVAVGGAASAIVAGWEHTCALVSGAVYCWGEGDYGRLGYANQNDVGDNETPASVGGVVLAGTATQLAAGSHHTCALVGNRARCWGRGLFGRLGYGSTVAIGDDETPASAGDVPLY